jgi:hypothetical protein
MTEKQKNTFRLNAKRAFLTYPHTNLSREKVLAQLEAKLGNRLKFYSISKENHQLKMFHNINDHELEPQEVELEKEIIDNHIHVYLKTNDRLDIRNLLYFDLLDGDARIYGHYESVKNKERVLAYIKKEDKDFLTNILLSDEEFYIRLYEIAKKDGLYKAMSYFSKTKPSLVATKFISVKAKLKRFLEHSQKREVISSYPINDYTYPQAILDWHEKYRNSKVLIVEGPTGFGKTEGMITFLISKGEKIQLVSSTDELYKIKNPEEITCFLFDAPNLKNVSRLEKINLFDMEHDRFIRTMYGRFFLSKDVSLLFTSEDVEETSLRVYNDSVKKRELERRSIIVSLGKPLFNINLTANNINKVFPV